MALINSVLNAQTARDAVAPSLNTQLTSRLTEVALSGAPHSFLSLFCKSDTIKTKLSRFRCGIIGTQQCIYISNAVKIQSGIISAAPLHGADSPRPRSLLAVTTPLYRDRVICYLPPGHQLQQVCGSLPSMPTVDRNLLGSLFLMKSMNFFMTTSASHCPSWMSSTSLCLGRMCGLLLMSLTAMMATGPSSGALNLVPSIGKIPPEYKYYSLSIYPVCLGS